LEGTSRVIKFQIPLQQAGLPFIKIGIVKIGNDH